MAKSTISPGPFLKNANHRGSLAAGDFFQATTGRDIAVVQ